jgi:hypothetical protein
MDQDTGYIQFSSGNRGFASLSACNGVLFVLSHFMPRKHLEMCWSRRDGV